MRTLQRALARPGLSNMLYCELLLSGSALSPFRSHKNPPLFLLLFSFFPSTNVCHTFFPAVTHFFFFWKDQEIHPQTHLLEPETCFSIFLHLNIFFPLFLVTSRQAVNTNPEYSQMHLNSMGEQQGIPQQISTTKHPPGLPGLLITT